MWCFHVLQQTRLLENSNKHVFRATKALFASQRMSVKARDTVVPEIKLKHDESQLFDLLKSVLRDRQLSTTVRVAGGWVRDRVLGHETNDIDVALDDMTGEAFARHVNEYLTAKGIETHRVAVIQANPEQSKHLETATVSVLGHELDFVNLRSETYNDGCRIPDMKFGTPLEDALRRDFTINALFYNVNTGQVEDFTRRGLADLQAGVIRTPLPAKDTFSDDPLRMLRAVRFATRFGFKCDDDITSALKDADIQNALLEKVSMERIGLELQGMLQGPRPLKALSILYENNLLPHVFRYNPSSKLSLSQGECADLVKGSDAPPIMAATIPAQSLKLARAMVGYFTLDNFDAGPLKESENVGQTAIDNSEMGSSARIDENHLKYLKQTDAASNPGIVALAGAMLPLAHETVTDNKGRTESVTKHILFDALKLKRVYKPLVVALKTSMEIENLLRTSQFSRLEVGHLILKAGELWYFSLVLGVAKHIMSKATVSQDNLDVMLMRREVGVLVDKIEAWHLEDLWKQNPHLTGKEIIALLNLRKGGPYVGLLLSEQQNILIRNPNGTKEECQRELQEFAKNNTEADFIAKISKEKHERYAKEKAKQKAAAAKKKLKVAAKESTEKKVKRPARDRSNSTKRVKRD